MAGTKKATKKVATKTTRKAPVKNNKENWKHIFAGFLLGMCLTTLLYSAFILVCTMGL